MTEDGFKYLHLLLQNLIDSSFFLSVGTIDDSDLYRDQFKSFNKSLQAIKEFLEV